MIASLSSSNSVDWNFRAALSAGEGPFPSLSNLCEGATQKLAQALLTGIHIRVGLVCITQTGKITQLQNNM